MRNFEVRRSELFLEWMMNFTELWDQSDGEMRFFRKFRVRDSWLSPVLVPQHPSHPILVIPSPIGSRYIDTTDETPGMCGTSGAAVTVCFPLLGSLNLKHSMWNNIHQTPRLVSQHHGGTEGCCMWEVMEGESSVAARNSQLQPHRNRTSGLDHMIVIMCYIPLPGLRLFDRYWRWAFEDPKSP